MLQSQTRYARRCQAIAEDKLEGHQRSGTKAGLGDLEEDLNEKDT